MHQNVYKPIVAGIISGRDLLHFGCSVQNFATIVDNCKYQDKIFPTSCQISRSQFRFPAMPGTWNGSVIFFANGSHSFAMTKMSFLLANKVNFLDKIPILLKEQAFNKIL